MRRSLYLLVLLVMAAGCATQDDAMTLGNENLMAKNIEEIKVGMTQEDVLRILGEADQVVSVAAGSKVWIYRGTEGEWVRPSAFSKKTTEIRARRLAVTLNPDGIVTLVEYDRSRETTQSPL